MYIYYSSNNNECDCKNIELSEINELTINGKLIIKDGEFTDKELKK